jgi:hypothetical protein
MNPRDICQFRGTGAVVEMGAGELFAAYGAAALGAIGAAGAVKLPELSWVADKPSVGAIAENACGAWGAAVPDSEGPQLPHPPPNPMAGAWAAESRGLAMGANPFTANVMMNNKTARTVANRKTG